MKYITFIQNKNTQGGLGHCFTDYLTAYIISNVVDNVKFIHNDIHVLNHNRYMNVNNNTKWNNFLNLINLSNVDINEIKNLEYIPLCLGDKWSNININLLKKKFEKLPDNKIYYIINSNRIIIFDLFHYEKNITKSIIIKLNDIFKNNKIKNYENNNKKKINIYLRRGDLNERKNNKRNNRDDSFVFNVLKLIYDKFLINKIEKYEINIISAGTKEQMNEVISDYSYFKNVNFLLNENEKKCFLKMTFSNILIFNASSFPLTASFFCDGLIIKKKSDKYICEQCIYKDIKFLDNYIIKDDIKEIDINKLKIYLN